MKNQKNANKLMQILNTPQGKKKLGDSISNEIYENMIMIGQHY